MADRVAVMNDGLLQQHGTPAELFEKPANVFVAKFIGEPPMNLIPCEMVAEGGKTWMKGAGLNLIMPDVLRVKAEDRASSSQLLLGARPQHMLIHRQGDVEDNGRNIVHGSVYITEPLGTELLVRVRVGNEMVQVMTSDDFEVGLDEAVMLEIPEDRIFLFDAGTEFRIG